MNRRLLAKASFIALAAAVAVPQAASAQGAIDAFRDEILVSAQKKTDAENVQDVPLAVTAYGSDQLDALKVRDLQDLSYSVPNVQLEDVGTTPNYANFSIRGLGINSSIPSIDPAVGVFVDGVYLGSPAGVVLDLFDLESVEVLRGPQGILFGRNVTGGAILINSKKPNLDEFTASFKGAGETGLRGTGGNYYAMASVSGPLIQDKLAIKLSGYYNKDQGWHKRYVGGPNLEARLDQIGGTASALDTGGFPIATNAADEFENFGKAETWMVRPSLLFAPTDSVEILLRYEHGRSEGQGPASQNHPGFAQLPFNGSITPPPVPVANPFFSVDKNSFTFAIDEPGSYLTEWDQATAEFNIDVPFGDGRITNIFGWRQSGGDTLSDIDATPFWLFHATSDTSFEQISNEIRYAGRFFDRVDLTLGFYYYDDEKVYQENRFILGGFRTFYGGGIQNSRNYGVFGQAEFDLTETFSLIAGGRWTNEQKDITLTNLTLSPVACSIAENTCPTHYTDDKTWKNFTPKLGFKWAATDEFNLYGTWSRGIRSGGYNFRNTSVLFPIERYEEETVDSFEVGFKAQPAGGRAVINAAFFYQEISDMQRELNLPDAIAGVVQLIRNTANAHIMGFEIESQVFLTDNLMFMGNLGRLDGEYDSVLFDLNSDGVVNETDLALQIPRLAPWTYGAGFIHTAGPVTTRFNWGHRADNAYTDNNLGILQGADIVDLNIAFDIMDNATISVYGQNLLNEVTHGGETQLPATLGTGSFAPLNKGRVVGIELKLDL
ncbi:MAG: TonB-dependent receptor [Amphiplicatus sp.]